MNTRLQALQPYPFARMNALLEGIEPPTALELIALSLGEPKHTPPQFALDYLADTQAISANLAQYPVSRGGEPLRLAISGWLAQRFAVNVDPERQILPVNGTREGLFSVAQALLSGSSDSLVMMPNPFYQIYEGAALLAGAQPVYVPNNPANGYHQDFDNITPETWARTEMVYICSPGNPTGQVMPAEQMQKLVQLALQYDFLLIADECYSEIYFDAQNPPPSLLNACIAVGNDTFKNCLIFHSLSKRSNLPGLRSGFVAGDAAALEDYFNYRTYHGCAMSPHHQHISMLAWSDEQHVQANRTLYQEKFALVESILAPHFPVQTPAGGFYHWLETPIDDTVFCQRLFAEQHVKVLPGQFLAREVQGANPGNKHVRLAWVASLGDCESAAQRLVELARGL